MKEFDKLHLRIPNSLINDNDEYALITYMAITINKQLFNRKIAKTSIFDICRLWGYSTTDRRSGSYLSLIKGILADFCDRGWIEIHQPQSKKIKPNELITIKLSDIFFPEKNYTSISMQELNDIINCTEYKSKASLIKVFLYIKSFMFMVYEGHTDSVISAYYVAGNIAADALKMSRSKYDLCVNVLLGIGLLVCHQTGSYRTKYGVVNAPNVYVLNNDDAERNIKGGISRLKYDLLDKRYGNGDDFMPIVYTGKTIKKRDVLELKESDTDDGEWGDSNPMSEYHIKGEN